jgi:hypothetical protein
MTAVSRFPNRRSPIWWLILTILWAVGCSRQIEVPTEGATQTDQTPFREKGGVEDEDAINAVAVPSRTEGNNSLPFGGPSYVPAGTLLTVRLKSPVTALSGAKGNPFQAITEEPVVVEGNTMIPPGTVVAGRIESWRISKIRPDRGYVRLALESLEVGGQDVPLRTASLFAPQAPQDEGIIRLEKGRRLTFRLTQALSLTGQAAQSSR